MRRVAVVCDRCKCVVEEGAPLNVLDARTVHFKLTLPHPGAAPRTFSFKTPAGFLSDGQTEKELCLTCAVPALALLGIELVGWPVVPPAAVDAEVMP